MKIVFLTISCLFKLLLIIPDSYCKCRGAGSRGSERETRRHEGTGEARDDERDVHAKVHERERERHVARERERERATHERERAHTHASATWRGVPLI